MGKQNEIIFGVSAKLSTLQSLGVGNWAWRFRAAWWYLRWVFVDCMPPFEFKFSIPHFLLLLQVAQHLARTYGDRAYKLGRSCKLTGRRWPVVGKRLHEDYPYLEEEVAFATKEYACTAVDVIARRLRLAFINTQAALECLPRVVDLMAEELKWSKAEKKVISVVTLFCRKGMSCFQANYDEAMEYLNKDMGRSVQAESRNVPINFSVEEINRYLSQFKLLDKENKGYITLPDIRRSLRVCCSRDFLLFQEASSVGSFRNMENRSRICSFTKSWGKWTWTGREVPTDRECYLITSWTVETAKSTLENTYRCVFLQEGNNGRIFWLCAAVVTAVIHWAENFVGNEDDSRDTWFV